MISRRFSITRIAIKAILNGNDSERHLILNLDNSDSKRFSTVMIAITAILGSDDQDQGISGRR